MDSNNDPPGSRTTAVRGGKGAIVRARTFSRSRGDGGVPCSLEPSDPFATQPSTRLVS